MFAYLFFLTITFSFTVYSDVLSSILQQQASCYLKTEKSTWKEFKYVTLCKNKIQMYYEDKIDFEIKISKSSQLMTEILKIFDFDTKNINWNAGEDKSWWSAIKSGIRQATGYGLGYETCLVLLTDDFVKPHEIAMDLVLCTVLMGNLIDTTSVSLVKNLNEKFEDELHLKIVF